MENDKISFVLSSVIIVIILCFLLLLIPFFFFFLTLAWTGEILRYLFTLGHHKPIWNLDSVKSFVWLNLIGDMSMYLGTAFWLLVVVLIRYSI